MWQSAVAQHGENARRCRRDHGKAVGPSTDIHDLEGVFREPQGESRGIETRFAVARLEFLRPAWFLAQGPASRSFVRQAGTEIVETGNIAPLLSRPADRPCGFHPVCEADQCRNDGNGKAERDIEAPVMANPQSAGKVGTVLRVDGGHDTACLEVRGHRRDQPAGRAVLPDNQDETVFGNLTRHGVSSSCYALSTMHLVQGRGS